MRIKKQQRVKVFQFGFITCALLLSACATTGDPSVPSQSIVQSKPAPIDRTNLSTEFKSLNDGGKYHPRTGLLCPPVVGGMTLEDTHSYRSDGTDVSCSHMAQGAELTTYLYPTDSFNFGETFESSAQQIYAHKAEQNFKYDEETSQQCTLQGLLMAALVNDQGAAGGGVSIKKSDKPSDDVYTYEVALFRNAEFVTALTLHEVDKQFLKLRYTERMADTSDETRSSAICSMLAQVTRDRHNEVRNPPKL